MGLLFPGSNGTTDRVEGNLLPYDGKLVKPGHAVTATAELMCIAGKDITAAVRAYIKRNPLPELPKQLPFSKYAEMAAHGWLDSAISQSGLFRHAYAPWGDFPAGPAADAALLTDWLATTNSQIPDARGLQEMAARAISRTPLADRGAGGVAHVRTISPCLNFGGVDESLARAETHARQLLDRFDSDGRVLYQPETGRPNMGKTHFEPDANGLTAQVVYDLLQSAAFIGDWKLIAQGAKLLHALDRFRGSAPRGAQTWEVPLHTPDILASANLVNAYTLGWKLTGDASFLESAEYWAWTGVPFIYLMQPVDSGIGLYATVPVLGATQWVSPNWMGLPVQWCGLVYSAALYSLSQAGSPNAAFWTRIADGITISGTEQVYPQQDGPLYGLLPDSFTLRSQTRNLAAINPGTLQMSAISLYRCNPVYQMHVLPDKAGIVHAPCRIKVLRQNKNSCTLEIDPWQTHSIQILISGANKGIHVIDENKQASPVGGYSTDKGRLLIETRGKTTLVISWPA
jgi:hypothetical protein